MARKRKTQVVYEPPSADEVVQRLKQWVNTHRRKTPFAKIALELGLPEKRFRNAMQGKDELRGFRWEILDRLEAADQGIEYKTRQGEDDTGEAPRKKELSPAEQDRINNIQLRTIERIEGTVFCCIVGQDISPIRCLGIQGQPECFGCAAQSRFCEECEVRPIAFPEVELCGSCLTKALASEKDMGIPSFPKDAKVECPLVDRLIGIATCRSMQGPSCSTCAAPSRICEECKSRQVRYPDYGWCLHCTVLKYGEGWAEEDSWSTEDDLLVEVGPDKEEEGEDEDTGVKLQRRYFPPGTHPNLIREVRELLGIKQKELARLIGQQRGASVSHLEAGRKLPNLVTALKLEIALGWSIGSLFAELKEQLQEELLKRASEGNEEVRSSIANRPRFPYEKFTVGKYLPRALVVRALELIATKRFCGRNYLERHLEIPEAQSKRLQAYLLRAGVIGPVVGNGKRRAIMVTPRNLDKVRRRLNLDGVVGMEETPNPPTIVEEEDLAPNDEPTLSEGTYGASVKLSVSLLPEERHALEVRSHELISTGGRYDLKTSRMARIAFQMLLEASDEEILRIAESVPNLEALRGRRRNNIS